jgi:hypothetical protein
MSWLTRLDLKNCLPKTKDSRSKAEHATPEEWIEKANKLPRNITQMKELLAMPTIRRTCASLGIFPRDLVPRTVYHYAAAGGRIGKVERLRFEAGERRRLELLSYVLWQEDERTRAAKRSKALEKKPTFARSSSELMDLELAKQQRRNERTRASMVRRSNAIKEDLLQTRERRSACREMLRELDRRKAAYEDLKTSVASELSRKGRERHGKAARSKRALEKAAAAAALRERSTKAERMVRLTRFHRNKAQREEAARADSGTLRKVRKMVRQKERRVKQRITKAEREAARRHARSERVLALRREERESLRLQKSFDQAEMHAAARQERETQAALRRSQTAAMVRQKNRFIDDMAAARAQAERDRIAGLKEEFALRDKWRTANAAIVDREPGPETYRLAREFDPEFSALGLSGTTRNFYNRIPHAEKVRRYSRPMTLKRSVRCWQRIAALLRCKWRIQTIRDGRFPALWEAGEIFPRHEDEIWGGAVDSARAEAEERLREAGARMLEAERRGVEVESLEFYQRDAGAAVPGRT